ncbi:cation-transporting P-type ATPase [Candidatus Babeliales bacterium]|nr:cation-transporting P-type ATPase [Candidatus Babeliales bacterium]
MIFSTAAGKTGAEVVKELETSLETGLFALEIKKRRQQYGLNVLQSSSNKWWHMLARQFASSFVYLLLIGAVISFFLGEYLNSGMILLFVGIMAVLGFYQEFFAQRTMQMLKKYVTYEMKVLRDGKEMLVDSSLLVPGDIVFLEPGDLITADMRLIEAEHVTIDESSLTGESVPVEKSVDKLENIEQVFEAKNMAFTGTTVVSGQAKGVVVAIGTETTFGRVARLTTKSAPSSRFSQDIKTISTFILYLVVLTLGIVFFVNFLVKGDEFDFVHMLIFSISLAVAVIPEALQVVINFSLAYAARIMTAKQVVVKRLSAIDDLGSIEILCTDKTGTITESIMEVADIFAYKPYDEKQVIGYATFAGARFAQSHQSFDNALVAYLEKNGSSHVENIERLDYVPFDPQRRRTASLVKESEAYHLIVRGAYEDIFALCNFKEDEQILAWIANQGGEGRRIIAIGHKQFTTKPDDLLHVEKEVDFVGLVSFSDPIKATAHDAIKYAAKLKIDIKILSGDAPEVVGAVGYKVGLLTSPHDVMLGSEFSALSEPEQREAAEKYHAFARISPEDKYRIVSLLSEKYTVGFLGDGVNDAPALKQAAVGIAVPNATDLAKDAADIILLENRIGVILDGVVEGRKVFFNTLKYLRVTLTSTFSNFFTISIAALLLPHLPMLPIQLLCLNILADLPLIFIATDTVDASEITRPERYNMKSLFISITTIGFVCSLFDFSFFSKLYKEPAAVLQTHWFLYSIASELFLFFALRSKAIFFRTSRPSNLLLIFLCVAAVSAISLPYTQFGQSVLSFVTPNSVFLRWIMTVVAMNFVVLEIVKRVWKTVFHNTEVVDRRR